MSCLKNRKEMEIFGITHAENENCIFLNYLQQQEEIDGRSLHTR
jgi:hypothetical protein